MSSSENPDLNPSSPPDGKCYSDDNYFNHGYDYDETSPLIDTSYLIPGYYYYESSSTIVTMSSKANHTSVSVSDKPMSSNPNPNPNCNDCTEITETTDEIMYQKFVAVAEKAFPADTTCGALKGKLQEIWHEVGEWYGKWMLLEIEQECVSVFKKNLDQDLLQQLQKIPEATYDDQCNKRWREIYRECLDVYKMKIKQAAESRERLLEELDFAADLHSKIALALDPGKEYVVPEKSNGTIRKQLTDTLVKLQPLLELKIKRKEMLADVQSQIQKIRGVAGTLIVDENDLSLDKLNRLHSELKELQGKPFDQRRNFDEQITTEVIVSTRCPSKPVDTEDSVARHADGDSNGSSSRQLDQKRKFDELITTEVNKPVDSNGCLKRLAAPRDSNGSSSRPLDLT